MRNVSTKQGQQASAGDARRDRGSSGVELIGALGVIGVMASIATLMVTGMTTQAAETSCLADAKSLAVAAATYMVTTDVSSIPATVTVDDIDHDRFEMTLVSNGYLRQPSELHDLTPSGAIIPTEDSSC
jgi:hypothetical protein